MTRGYHNLTAYYNVYYNGKDAFKSGFKKIDDTFDENYSLLIPVFKYSNKEAARSSYGDMNRAIEKGSKCVHKHSITVKPKIKPGKKVTREMKEFRKKKEFVKWIDDSYLLIGKANFIKGDYFPAIETFNFIVKEYGDVPAKFESYMWLARTYTEMKKYGKALDFISKLEADKELVPVTLKGPIVITKTDILIRQKKYTEAIPFLEKGIELTKSKKEKVRYHYLLAQLYQKIQQNKKAYIAYGHVIDLNPEYEMAFNAKINRASIFSSTSGDSKSLQRQLYKMLKDDKNFDFRDQIYFALGSIAFNESRDDDAIDLYKHSAQSSTKNTYQKSMSYLAIADIYFDRPDYTNSQIYYDSAVTYLDNAHPDYTDIKIKSSNLNNLVKNIMVITKEDSLQRVAKMPESNRNMFIDSLIAKVIEQEKIAKELEAQRKQDMMFAQRQGGQATQSGGKWYFYNPATLSSGQAEFITQWGERKNEDNWRRKNKAEMNWDNDDEEQESADSSKNEYSNKTREFYMVDLPLTDSAIIASNTKIEEAYFNLANIYNEKFQDAPLSIEAYNHILTDYPDTEFRLSIYYSLYKLYALNKQLDKAEEYKQKIINEYPDSDYAKILLDPDYYKQLEQMDKQVNFIYQASYKFFLNNNCTEVGNNFTYVDSAFKESKLIPKFALLDALCRGRSSDSTTFKTILAQYITDYPKTEESEYANEVLMALDRERREVELKKEEEREKEFGGDIANDNSSDSLDISIYKYSPKQKHYYLMVVNDEKADSKRIKFNLENFNLDYYSYLNFEVASELLSATYTIITTSEFKNSKMASNYYESVIIAGEVLKDAEKDSYRTFIVTMDNIKKFKEDKNIRRLQQFFESNYGPFDF